MYLDIFTDEYYECHLCELVLSSWRKLSSIIHVILPRKAKMIQSCHTQYHLLIHWQNAWRHQKVQDTKVEDEVVRRATLNTLKRFWMFWKDSIAYTKKREMEEAAIAAKWDYVKVWLENREA